MSNPIKPNFKTEWFSLAIIMLSFLAGYYFYQIFPDRIPTHWNFKGEVDGYSGPLTVSLLFPLLSLGIYLLFILLPNIDPKKEQYAKFRRAYHAFKDLLITFLFILFMLVGLNGIGYNVKVTFWSPILIGVLFMTIGLLLNKMEMNWFMGIRTPWTMSSEEVWRKTHKLSSKVLILAGVLMSAISFVPSIGKSILFILTIVLIVLALPIYSYILFRRQQTENK